MCDFSSKRRAEDMLSLAVGGRRAGCPGTGGGMGSNDAVRLSCACCKIGGSNIAEVVDVSVRRIRPVKRSTEIRIRRLESISLKYNSSLSKKVNPSVSEAILSKIV